MDRKLVGTTFAAVFLAELGDKTQIATMTLAGSGSSRLVFLLLGLHYLLSRVPEG